MLFVGNTSNTGASDKLYILSSYALQSVFTDYTTEEYLNSKLTETCIDHFSTITNAAKIGSGIIPQKLDDHYFVRMMAFGGDSIDFRRNEIEYRFFLHNRMVDDLMKRAC